MPTRRMALTKWNTQSALKHKGFIMTYHTIYETTNTVNGKTYIGAHKSRKMVDGYLGSGSALKNAVRKYGRKNFKKTIILTARDEKSMFQAERAIVNKEYVARRDTYNLKTGGEGCGVVRPVMNGKKNGMYGVNHSEESKRLMADARIGKRASEETRKKMSLSHSGAKHHLFEVGHSEEAKARMSTNRIGKAAGKKNPMYNPCYVIAGSHGSLSEPMSKHQVLREFGINPSSYVSAPNTKYELKRGKLKGFTVIKIKTKRGQENE